LTYESSNGSAKFIYRKINDFEIEKIKWLSPTLCIFISPYIDNKLNVVFLGTGTFQNLLDIKKL